jgi:DNA-binding transcriptional MerR regulator
MAAKAAAKPIPDKLYFPMLQPVKESSGHRRYRRKDIELVLEIKRLLYDEGFTIAGARTALQKGTPAPTLFAVPAATGRKRSGRAAAARLAAKSPEEVLQRVRAELDDILTLLK